MTPSDAPSNDAARSCELFARAKINLALRILAREQNGYHQIETTFCLIELADEIAVTLTPHDISLVVESAADDVGPPPDLGPDEANLAYRAALNFLHHTGASQGAHIRLVKRIPAGAGLGGGSSDAATVLEALNMLHGLPLSRAQLTGLGATLGCDVPFFMARAPLALAWGRGDRIAVLPPVPARPVLLAIPSQAMSTVDAYAALDRARGNVFAAPARVIETAPDWNALAADAANEFETIVFERQPALARVRQSFVDWSARIARLTGSGSAVFGIFDSEQARDDARQCARIEFPSMRLITTSTATL